MTSCSANVAVGVEHRQAGGRRVEPLADALRQELQLGRLPGVARRRRVDGLAFEGGHGRHQVALPRGSRRRRDTIDTDLADLRAGADLASG